MNKNIEKELKILVSEQAFHALQKQYPNLVFHTQTNVYFDTLENDLRSKKMAMRIRSVQCKHIFTLKINGLQGLEEYECEVFTNDSSALQQPEIIQLLQQLNIDLTFHVIANCTTHRAIYENEFAQLCFDHNEFMTSSDYELEYEYKKEHDGVSAFNTILSKIGMQYKSNCDPKIVRALCTTI